ncbi:MAG: hypothetical protein H7301_08810 [Cryobacterium sp.]|nr:hypothetical protein [Oligoflexia bacterium]
MDNGPSYVPVRTAKILPKAEEAVFLHDKDCRVSAILRKVDVNFFAILFGLLLQSVLTSPVLASSLTPAEMAPWLKMASGDHSLRTLGPAYFVDVPVRRIPGARLAFFNHEAARRLGLVVPEDPDELESLMVSLFAFEVDPTGNSPVKQMAVRYQDSKGKGPGDARGDGRATWPGELKLVGKTGKTISIDVVRKGGGATELAWTSHDAAHSDGVLKIRELVRSAITSKANEGNILDSTDDLMGFTFRKEDRPLEALSIRIGNQTRIAQLRYFADDPKLFQPLMDYVIARDLGLPAGAVIRPAEVQTYLEFFVDNLAEEAARYTSGSAVHGSPTAGNRTTKGGTIDLMEFWWMDAFHANFSYLFNQRSVRGQADTMRDYVVLLLRYMGSGGYPIPSSGREIYLTNRFEGVYTQFLAELDLNRLGLSSDDIRRIPQRLQNQFRFSVTALRQCTGTEKRRIFWQDIEPAAFDVRNILKSTFRFYSDSDRSSRIFSNQRTWATPLSATHQMLEQEYLSIVDAIVKTLDPAKKIQQRWIEKASAIGGYSRLEPGTDFPATESDPFFQKYEQAIIEKLQNGVFSVREINDAIRVAGESLVDPELLARRETSSVIMPGFPTFSSSQKFEACPDLLVPIRP